MIRENTRQTSWILKKENVLCLKRKYILSDHLNLHKNNEENHTFESEKFTEGVDKEVHEEEGALDQQHGPVPGQGQLHGGQR